MYLNRSIGTTIENMGNTSKAILIIGPSEVGKTTLVKHLFQDKNYKAFDNPLFLAETLTDPDAFFKNNNMPIILDEVQRISNLFPYIKAKCDESDGNGIFVLIGTQQYPLIKSAAEDLDGTVAILEMTGLSLREIQEASFYEPFVPSKEYIAKRRTNYQSCNDIWKRIHRGGNPTLLDDRENWHMFFNSYLRIYLERDLTQLSKVRYQNKFVQFMEALAARTGEVLNYSLIADQVGLTVATIKQWVWFLETTGIIYILEPFSNPALSRAIKTPKLYFRDTGLACFLTKYQTPEAAASGELADNLFENFVVSEIIKSYSNAGKDYQNHITYYRCKDKKRLRADQVIERKETEISLIIEQNDIVHPVQIKLSANPSLDMAKNFASVSRLSGKKCGMGAIICLVGQELWMKGNVVALPVEYI